MTDNLEELERLLAKATPGEWVFDETVTTQVDLPCVSDQFRLIVAEMLDDGRTVEECEHNAALIVALRNAAPSLIATAREVEGLRAEVARLREDAERWQALLSSARFKMIGSAGFIHNKDGSVSINPDNDYGWLHFGIEVWDNHPAGNDAQGIHGRNLLLAYVDHRRALEGKEPRP